jgi:ferredoxin
MATIEAEGKQVQVNDGDAVQQGCEELGVPFGCTSGICGTCIVEVEEGMENLSHRTQEEVDMMLETNQRLMCQCKINGGLVKIKF